MSLFPSNLAVGIIWWDEYHDGKLAVVFFSKVYDPSFPMLGDG